MKILFILLMLSTGTLLVAAVALWWRLRWHLQRSNKAQKQAKIEIQPERESVEHI